MDATAWTVIGSAVAILVSIGATFRSLRAEIRDVRGDIVQLRERMAHLDGLLEGLREAIAGRQVA